MNWLRDGFVRVPRNARGSSLFEKRALELGVDRTASESCGMALDSLSLKCEL